MVRQGRGHISPWDRCKDRMGNLSKGYVQNYLQGAWHLVDIQGGMAFSLSPCVPDFGDVPRRKKFAADLSEAPGPLSGLQGLGVGDAGPPWGCSGQWRARRGAIISQRQNRSEGLL